jgi:4-hydroxybenzoate polyprenyltransferase
LGLTFLASGALSLLVLGTLAGGMALMLIGTILLYNSVHRLILFSPVLLGICRFFLYLIAASTSHGEITGKAIWCGLALACYMVGLGYFVPRERSHTPLSFWPVLALTCPILLALIMNADGYRENALLISAVVALWIAQCLRYTLWSVEREPSRTITGLVAGIAFVDWLAVADGPRSLAALFLVLFGATLALQQWD